MKRILYFASVLGVGLTACGKWIVGDNPLNTPMSNYEYLYTTVRDNYSFIDADHVNWDSIDRVYRPMVHDSLSNDSLFMVLSAMLNALQDGHVNIYNKHTRSAYHDFFLDYEANFNSGFVQRNYWRKDYESASGVLHKWLPDSIAYIYYGSFSSSFSESNVDYIMQRYAHAKGLIMDVRDNGGGSMSNVFRWVSRFTSDSLYVGTFDFKSGTEKADFSKPDSIFISPYVKKKVDKPNEETEKKKKSKQKKTKESSPDTTAKKDPPVKMFLNKPVTVLTNRACYSATNFFSSYMSLLPNVVLIGDKTGGGGGVPTSFELPNGWTFRYSASRTLLPDGYNIEQGIEPDIYQSTGPREELEGVDAIIERARAYILEKSLVAASLKEE